MGSHNDLALTFGILGNVISFLVYLAPTPTFYGIYKRKSTEGFQSLPYHVALFSSMLWLYYALLKPEAALLITINSLGCVIEIIYIVMYTIYATRDSRNLTVKLFMVMNVGCFTLIFLITYFAIHGSLRVQVVGWICVSIAISTVSAAPLSIVASVIRTKSVEFMSFCLSFFVTFSAIIWSVYGLFVKDICITIPNVLGFILGLLQMMIYGIYRPIVTKEEQAPEAIRRRNVENQLGASEVYPIPIINEKGKESAEDAKKKEKNMECKEFPA